MMKPAQGFVTTNRFCCLNRCQIMCWHLTEGIRSKSSIKWCNVSVIKLSWNRLIKTKFSSSLRLFLAIHKCQLMGYLKMYLRLPLRACRLGRHIKNQSFSKTILLVTPNYHIMSFTFNGCTIINWSWTSHVFLFMLWTLFPKKWCFSFISSWKKEHSPIVILLIHPVINYLHPKSFQEEVHSSRHSMLFFKFENLMDPYVINLWSNTISRFLITERIRFSINKKLETTRAFSQQCGKVTI